MEVYTVGGSDARSPCARTTTEVNGSRFFLSTLRTSVAVQEQRAMSTSSMGPDAVLLWRLESMTKACPLDAEATKRSPSVHCTRASTIKLPPVIRERFGVYEHLEKFGLLVFHADLELSADVVDIRQREII